MDKARVQICCKVGEAVQEVFRSRGGMGSSRQGNKWSVSVWDGNMPSIKDESTVEAIARAFTSNGRNEEQGMLSAGYSKSYARSGLGHRIYADIRLKTAIARIDAENAEIGQRTVAGIDEMNKTHYNTSKTLNQPSAMVSAVTGLARLYGMDKDNQVNTDKPNDLTPDELEVLRADAKRLTDLKLRTG